MSEIQKELSAIHPLLLLLIFLLLFLQGMWVFHDAQKRGAKKWFWGIWCLTSSPGPLIVYLLVVCKLWKSSLAK